MTTVENARLLFVIDNDFGELTLAMLFVHGRSLAPRTTMLLPPRLYDLNGEGLPVRTRRYTGYDDLKEAIADESPDVVVLFSGYLLPIHQLVSVSQLKGLTDELREGGSRVVTSDPFWGLLTVPAPRISPQVKALTDPVAVVKELTHLYVIPLEVEGIRSVSFFNPSFVASEIAAVPDEFWSGAGLVEAPGDGGHWLFALTGEDYATQVMESSRAQFAQRVAVMISDTVSAGRCPVLLAPNEFLEDVAPLLGEAHRAVLLPYCAYNLFLALLAHAEYVFYWNAGSTSGHLRMLLKRPQFSFEPGHIARHVEDWLQRSVREYYLGWEPRYLGAETRLHVSSLARMAADYGEAAERIGRQRSRLATPEQVIEQVLGMYP